MDLLEQADQPPSQYMRYGVLRTRKRAFKKRPYSSARGKYKIDRPEIEQPLNPFIRHIPLTKDMYTIVDAHLYDWLMEWNWHAKWNYKTRSFYAVRCDARLIGQKGHSRAVFMHRQILGLESGNKLQGDHQDRNSLNNTGANLRIVDTVVQAINHALQRNNKSGYRGVSWAKRHKSWDSTIKFRGIHYFLGRFKIKEEAARARDLKAIELHGEFAVLNFPREEYQ